MAVREPGATLRRMLRVIAGLLLCSTAALAVEFEPVIVPGEFKALVVKGATPQRSRMTLKSGELSTATWTGQAGGAIFALSTTDYPAAMLATRPAKAFLDETRDGLANQLRGKVVSEKRLEQPAPGLAFVISSSAGTATGRAFLSGSRLYSLFVLGDGGEATEKFLSALEVLGAPKPPAPPVAETPVAGAAQASDRVELRDPKGDDVGPGGYTYPQDPVYRAGSFDLLAARVISEGDQVHFELELAAPLEDPWKMGTGFSVQHAVVFLDLDGDPKNGVLEGLPGQNVSFAPGHGWDRAVLITPQGRARALKELEAKAASLGKSVIVPEQVKGAGRIIRATVKRAQLAGGDLRKWRYQVTLTSQDGFPPGKSVLVRQVNEYPGPHRFGGGNDGDCDPHVIDLFAGMAVGASGEADAQRKLLRYECEVDGTVKQRATLELIKP